MCETKFVLWRQVHGMVLGSILHWVFSGEACYIMLGHM